MNRFWRVFLLCCLSLALPMKGWALALMPCATSVAVVSAAKPPCHDVSPQAASLPTTDGVTGALSDQLSLQTSHSHKTCSVCMCGVSALPLAFAAELRVQPPLGHVQALPALVVAFDSHHPQHTDPPPKDQWA